MIDDGGLWDGDKRKRMVERGGVRDLTSLFCEPRTLHLLKNIYPIIHIVKKRTNRDKKC